MTYKKQYSLKLLCDIFEVSRSSYYEWTNRVESNRSKGNKKLMVSIKTSFFESKETYGVIRVLDDLRDQNIVCNKKRVARLMSLEGLKSVHKRKFKPCTTDSKHPLPIASNVIHQDFSVKGPNEKWGCDITYIPTREGFLYLAIVLDFFSRKIVGFSMDDSMKTSLCSRALKMALTFRQPPKTLIHHSDRGSQYASEEYRSVIQNYGFIQSMSRKGNCYDNAMVESFFHTLKVELVHRIFYQTKNQAKEDITDYIYNFYNSKRKHSALDYQAPNNYENTTALISKKCV